MLLGGRTLACRFGGKYEFNSKRYSHMQQRERERQIFTHVHTCILQFSYFKYFPLKLH